MSCKCDTYGKNSKGYKITLCEDEMPRKYYNILPDLPTPLDPPMNPGTGKPAKPEELEAIFTKEAVRQEMSSQRFIDIPDEVVSALFACGRPTPMFRAHRLEAYLKTPAKIYFKHEGLNPCGSHKPNTAIAQAYYAMKEGVQELVTETGAGQWGTALSYACALYGMKCRVFMVASSYEQKPYRRIQMETYGAKVYSSPSRETEYGRKLSDANPEHSGSLGIAISEAIETVVKTPNSKYSLGSVLNHVMLHQTVIGQEAKIQLAKEDITPDVLIACVGGGSNFAGFTFPFVADKIAKKTNPDIIAVEPTSAPSITKGKYDYDHGDSAGMTPLLKMYTLGKDFIPAKSHAGGLRYHGMAPTVSSLAHDKLIRAVAYSQKEVFEAGMVFARTEGIVAAPESCHAIKAAIDVAAECKKKGEQKTIVFNLSGQGQLDLEGYADYMAGKI